MAEFRQFPNPQKYDKREKSYKEIGKEREREVDTFIGNHTVVDPEIFNLWLEGNSPEEASTIMQQRGTLNTVPGATMEFLLAEVMDHYRMYGMLEKLLQNPPRIADQWTFQIDIPSQKMIIEHYYSFDDHVMREIIGRKLSSRNRKDLDEVSEKTGINIRSCRRQFDNAKRVFKAVEELSGSLYQNIKTNFLLSDDLAKKYCAVVFLIGNRFETNKKKLNYLTFMDLFNCAHAMMSHWTSPIVDEDSTADVEREFLMDLRDLRVLLDKEKEHKTIVCQKLKSRVSDKILTELDHNFKVYSRTLINIAYGLNHSRELKDLFLDLVEKYIEPCKQINWTVAEMQVFFDEYTEAAFQLDVVKSQQGLKSVWKRYMDGIKGCVMAMYHTHQLHN